MKYPPYSWLRLSDDIRQSPSRIWFQFNRLPSKTENCLVKIHIGGQATSITDPYDAIANKNILLPRQERVLERFLKLAKPTKSKSEFILDHASFGIILPYCSAIPFEIAGLGVINASKLNARIKASFSKGDKTEAIEFSLLSGSQEKIKEPRFFGDINAYVLDHDLKLQLLVPNLTQSEAEAILSSPPLPLMGLCQKDSRQMFYALSRLGIDFSCLHKIALEPDHHQIVLRLLLDIDDITKKMVARAHLVTELEHGNFKDEVEIRATGTIPSLHIKATSQQDEEKFVDDIKTPELLLRPHEKEKSARAFLYQLGAGPARLHDGYELTGDDAFSLLKAISQKKALPTFLKLDDKACPTIIELDEKPTFCVRAQEANPSRVEVALSVSPGFDEKDADFSIFQTARDSLLVLDEDTLVVLNDEITSTISYFAQTLQLERPLEYKSKSIAQVALLLNALGSRIHVQAEPELRAFLEGFSLSEEEADRILPQGLKTTLRPYQHDAVSWLSALHRSGLGGLLGDEMGLGKTLMVLTHLARLKEQGFSKKPALVVCPTSVIDVWKEEARIHIPSLNVVKWHGSERDMLDPLLKDCDVLITSYAILRRDIQTKLRDMEFGTLILDEAQYVRNQQTDSFKSVKSIKCTHRLALTGTPIENHLSDLYNIMDCVEEGILGQRSTFEKQFANPIEQGNMSVAFNLKMLLSPVMMRRKKAEVESELPPKIENIVHCPLSPEQKVLYKQFINQLGGALGNTLSPDAVTNSHTHFTLLSALTRLRQICCHPSLILGKEGQEHRSGKLDALREIMAECLEMNRKIIIYSQFLKMQEHIVEIAQELDSKGALWLHGSTQNRHEIVSQFQKEDGPKIIVVSLKAGGTGITLTEADTVIFADPWWNPAVEDQAIDRAHRIGQKKTVHVIRLIAKDSIECEVVALAEKKRSAAQSVLHEGFKSATTLTREEVRNLLLREIDRLRPAGHEESEALEL